LTVTFLYAGSSIQNAGEQIFLCIHLSFVILALYPNKQQKLNGEGRTVRPRFRSKEWKLQYQLKFAGF
jgi:hypothetical protein